MKANGDCYEAAGQYMMMKCQFSGNCDNLTLVHGEVAGQGQLEGMTYGHAWVLDAAGNVIDKSNGRDLVLPKIFYYSIGQIDNIGNVHEYAWDEVRKLILTNEHWGPWDLVTESGY